MKNKRYLSVIFGVSIILIIISFIILFPNGINEESVRVMIRMTAKSSATLFAIAFGVSGFQSIFKDNFSRILLQYRPNIGLAFGVAHSFHLFFLIWLQNAIHPVFTLAKTTSLIGGGLAYLFMYLMMLTTFPYFKSKISIKQWKILHIVGGYWIWVIFIRSYFRQVTTQERGYFLFALMLLVLVLRIIHLLLKRKQMKIQ